MGNWSLVTTFTVLVFSSTFGSNQYGSLPLTDRQTVTCKSASKKLDNYVIDSSGATNREDNDQIVGGVEVKAGSYPFQAAMLSGGVQFCGGSLIDPSHVLTAAHCVDAFYPEDLPNLKIYLNTVTLKPDEGAVVRGVKRVTFPNSYNSATHEYDIAILTLSSPVTTVSPVKLPPSGSNALFTGLNVTVIGWGTTSYQGKSSSVLLETTVKVVSNAQCSSMYDMEIPQSFVCAMAPNKDTCQGDSGGPMLFKGVQIGVVSWGHGCAEANYPGVYTRVTSYLTWINQTKSAC